MKFPESKYVTNQEAIDMCEEKIANLESEVNFYKKRIEEYKKIPEYCPSILWINGDEQYLDSFRI
jgi:outer membrane protein assembly factor BamD (BamD/ComL family)